MSRDPNALVLARLQGALDVLEERWAFQTPSAPSQKRDLEQILMGARRQGWIGVYRIHPRPDGEGFEVWVQMPRRVQQVVLRVG